MRKWFFSLVQPGPHPKHNVRGREERKVERTWLVWAIRCSQRGKLSFQWVNLVLKQQFYILSRYWLQPSYYPGISWFHSATIILTLTTDRTEILIAIQLEGSQSRWCILWHRYSIECWSFEVSKLNRHLISKMKISYRKLGRVFE